MFTVRLPTTWQWCVSRSSNAVIILAASALKSLKGPHFESGRCLLERGRFMGQYSISKNIYPIQCIGSVRPRSTPRTRHTLIKYGSPEDCSGLQHIATASPKVPALSKIRNSPLIAMPTRFR